MSEQKASRELDAMVAERVDGLSEVGWWLSGEMRFGPRHRAEIVPYYSSDTSAAMQVAERMIANGWRIYIDGPCSEDRKWRVMFAKERGTEWEYGDTLAEAICLAALKAIEADFSTPTDEAR